MIDNLFALKDKIILVTGSSSGIGRGIAIVLSHLGAKLVLHGRDEMRLREVLGELTGEGHRIWPFDLTDLENVSRDLGDFLKNEDIFIDALVHCAGLHCMKPLGLLKPKDLASLFQVNVSSGIFLAKAFRQQALRRANSQGNLLFMSSVVGEVGQPGILPYAISKGAINAAVKSLAIELAPDNIRVNAIAPGVVKTPMTDNLFAKLLPDQLESIKALHPLGLGEVNDVAHLAAYLLSPISSWVTGQIIVIDGGYTAH